MSPSHLTQQQQQQQHCVSLLRHTGPATANLVQGTQGYSADMSNMSVYGIVHINLVISSAMRNI